MSDSIPARALKTLSPFSNRSMFTSILFSRYSRTSLMSTSRPKRAMIACREPLLSGGILPSLSNWASVSAILALRTNCFCTGCSIRARSNISSSNGVSLIGEMLNSSRSSILLFRGELVMGVEQTSCDRVLVM